ncbi:MAG: YeeE/YedE family protein [Gammaproteobacteria bacterium]|nr:YeeE/YedE family protein [Gammaproteobacteria bacterium]
MNEINTWLVGGGLAVGAMFAMVLHRFRFCLVAGVSNFMLIRDSRQILAFASAWLVAIAGTQLLEITGIVAVADSAYRDPTMDWLGASIGGFVFGLGAALAGGCAARTLVRAMEGSAHSLIALISFALVSAVTQFGFLEPFRVKLTQETSIALLADAGIASLLSLPSWLVLGLVVTGLLFFIYKIGDGRPDKPLLIAGGIVGGLVVFSWYITGVLAQDELMVERPSAMTLSGPLARFGYMLISGQLPALSFTTSFVIGTAVVSLLLALVTRQFRITAPAKGMAKMALLGGALMGFGAITAYGCNIGQGLSGISTLSLESLIAVVSMIAGICVVTRLMEKYA